MSTKNAVVKATGLMVAVGFLAKVLGFIREMVIAREFGTTWATDAYLVALIIPNLFFTIAGSALSTVVVPIFYGIQY